MRAVAREGAVEPVGKPQFYIKIRRAEGPEFGSQARNSAIPHNSRRYLKSQYQATNVRQLSAYVGSVDEG